MRQTGNLELYTQDGQRKYLVQEERENFSKIAKLQDRETRTFCLLLLYTGCRISEGLNLTVASIDYKAKAVIIESLKKRVKGKYRKVPLSDEFLDELDLVHNLRSAQRKKSNHSSKIWNWSRRTASRRIDQVMKEANINGAQASAKGLRHSFVIHCLLNNVPITLVQKWLGHSSLAVTAIYANVGGQEERELAQRIW